MRVMLRLAWVLAALAFALSGCSGDDEQQQRPQPQPATPAAQEAETTAARPASAESEQPAATEAEDAQPAAPPVEAEDRQGGEGPLRDPLFAEAEAAYQAWSDSLRTFVLDAEVEVDFGGLDTQVQTTIWMQVEPLTILMSVDGSVGMGIGGGEAEQAAAPVQVQILLSEESAYLSMPDLGGWVDVSEDFEELLGGLTALLGADPEEFANPDGLGQAFGCVDVVGGAIAVERYAGEPVWMVDCEIDVESLNEASAQALTAMGLTVVDSGIETMHLRMAISQATGAPLLLESYLTLADPLGVMGGDGDDSGDEAEAELYISQSATLRSWNEPIDFPATEPLVDGSMLGAFAGPGDDGPAREFSEPPELLDAEQLLDLAADWVAGTDEMELQFAAQAVIDGESRLAATSVWGSRSQGAFETAVKIDDGDAFRLLWNRDGIWVSDSEEDGEPIWAPSSPALLGFAGLSVDEFLAEPDRLDLEPLRALLGVSWVTRTIEGGRPPVYELGIESGYLAPGDPNFDQIVEMLRADTAELLAENVIVEQIDHFSVVITLMGDDGELVGQVTTAEFVTNAGRVELMASLQLVSDGPIVFSTPTK